MFGGGKLDTKKIKISAPMKNKLQFVAFMSNEDQRNKAVGRIEQQESHSAKEEWKWEKIKDGVNIIMTLGDFTAVKIEDVERKFKKMVS